jgi:hypothetical protein
MSVQFSILKIGFAYGIKFMQLLVPGRVLLRQIKGAIATPGMANNNYQHKEQRFGMLSIYK